MNIKKQYNEFINKYTKKICMDTYKKYKDVGYTDLKIATTDLRGKGNSLHKNTIRNRMNKFNEDYGYNVSYSYYYGRIKNNISEKEMLVECHGGLKAFPQGPNKKRETVKEEVKKSKFKPLPRIDLNIEAGDDDYYLTHI